MQKDLEFDDIRLKCEQHPIQSYSTICYGENSPYKRRLLCVECTSDTKDNKNLISLQKFFQDPIGVLDQNSELDKFSKNMLILINNIETEINNLHQKFQNHIRKLKEELENIQTKNREQLIQKIKIKEFQYQLNKVSNMDTCERSEELSLLEKQLNDIIVDWKNFSQQDMIDDINQKVDQIWQDFTIYRHYFLEQQQQILDIQLINLNKELIRRFDQVNFLFEKEISRGKEIQYQLLYQGIRDGLKLANYWQKCDQQSHLLTIISLKNGNIFGGYSPCQLNRALGNFVADHTHSSFIFQQNKQEIYKIKEKYKAIYCQQDYGPSFGGGCDLKINDDFMSLSSNLGVSYDISGYDVQNINNHLIGNRDKKIIDCKVYKIRFL